MRSAPLVTWTPLMLAEMSPTVTLMLEEMK